MNAQERFEFTRLRLLHKARVTPENRKEPTNYQQRKKNLLHEISSLTKTDPAENLFIYNLNVIQINGILRLIKKAKEVK